MKREALRRGEKDIQKDAKEEKEEKKERVGKEEKDRLEEEGEEVGVKRLDVCDLINEWINDSKLFCF